jgi:hypothetical protein
MIAPILSCSLESGKIVMTQYRCIQKKGLTENQTGFQLIYKYLTTAIMQ